MKSSTKCDQPRWIVTRNGLRSVHAMVSAALLVLWPEVAIGQVVDAHISRADIKVIVQVIKTDTAEPVCFIHPVYTSKYIPGAVSIDGLQIGPTGTTKIREYEMPGRVRVKTRFGDKISGHSYEMQKVDGRWKILSKGRWIR